MAQERQLPLRVGRSGVHAWGLYATQTIAPESFVIEYVGELLRRPLDDVRERVSDSGPVCCSHVRY